MEATSTRRAASCFRAEIDAEQEAAATNDDRDDLARRQLVCHVCRRWVSSVETQSFEGVLFDSLGEGLICCQAHPFEEVEAELIAAAARGNQDARISEDAPSAWPFEGGAWRNPHGHLRATSL